MKNKLLILATALLAACGATTTTKTNNDTATNTSETAASAQVPPSNKGSDITVTLTGGPNAGTYKATSAESTCSMGLAGDKAFGNQYSEKDKGEKELSSVQLIGNDYEEATKGTANFNVMVGFGKLLGGTTYSLDPTKKDGTGKLTITESGSGKVATVEGTTKEGVGMKVVLTCKTINKMVDGQLKEE